MVCSAEAQLLGSKAYVGIGYARQLFDFVFHLGSAVSTAKVLQNIYTFYLVGIRHTAGAISQAFAAYIAVFLMRMANFAIAVSRMTGHVMTMCVSVFVTMIVTATALFAVCVSVFMSVVVSTAAVIAVCMSMFFMFMVMFMIVSATAGITMSMLGHMSHSFVIMILAAVTAGAAFRRLAVIFYAINMAVNVSESSYIAGTITDIL